MFGQRTTFVFNNKYMHVDFGKCISKSSKQHKSQSLVHGIITFEKCFFTQEKRVKLLVRILQQGLYFYDRKRPNIQKMQKKRYRNFHFIYTLNMYNQIALHDIKSHSTGSPSVDLCLCCIFFSLFILVSLYCFLIEL